MFRSLYFRPPYINRVTREEALQLLSCPMLPVGEEMRFKLYLGTDDYAVFDQANITSILGKDFRKRLEASSIGWRCGLATLPTPKPDGQPLPAVPTIILDLASLRTRADKMPERTPATFPRVASAPHVPIVRVH